MYVMHYIATACLQLNLARIGSRNSSCNSNSSRVEWSVVLTSSCSIHSNQSNPPTGLMLLVVMLAACSSGIEARSILSRQLSAATKAQQQQQKQKQQQPAKPVTPQQQQQQQAPPVLLAFKDLKPTLSSTWIPTIASDHPSVQVPVVGTPGTPSPPAAMSRIQYTVTYTRRPSYVIQGNLSISTAAFSSADGGSDTAGGDAAISYTVVQPPTINISQQGTKEPQPVPVEGIACRSYTLKPGGSIICGFTAQIFAFGEAAPPGSVQASIQVTTTGSSSGMQPAASSQTVTIQTPAKAYEWPVSTAASNSNMRLAGTDSAQQYLQDTMQSSTAAGGGGGSAAAATVTNYFEPGEGRVLPQGVEGKQPAANSLLQETASFTYVALIPDVPRELCRKPLQVGGWRWLAGVVGGCCRWRLGGLCWDAQALYAEHDCMQS